MKFDPQPTLSSDTLLLRPLEADDFKGLQAAAGDAETWAGHPAKDRHNSDVFRGYFDYLLSSGSTLVVIDQAAEKPIGCSRYYTAPDMPGSISIGFTFLHHAYWGGAWNFEMKRLMLGHAFAMFDEVWFHIDPTNLRSQKATSKLGAEHVYDAELALVTSPVDWQCYRLMRDVWMQKLATQS